MGDLAASGAGLSTPSLFTGGRHALSEVVFVLPLRGRTPDRREELHGAGRVPGLRQFEASLRRLLSPLAHPADEGAGPATGFLSSCVTLPTSPRAARRLPFASAATPPPAPAKKSRSAFPGNGCRR